jgi:hypothetical protein
MNPNKPESDSDPAEDASPKRIPAWARAPIFMYLTMVTAFLIAGMFVLYYLIHMGRSDFFR